MPPSSTSCDAMGRDTSFDSISWLQGFVMADTTYNSHGVDEVAAQHVNAQCVVSSTPCWHQSLQSLLQEGH